MPITIDWVDWTSRTVSIENNSEKRREKLVLAINGFATLMKLGKRARLEPEPETTTLTSTNYMSYKYQMLKLLRNAG